MFQVKPRERPGLEHAPEGTGRLDACAPSRTRALGDRLSELPTQRHARLRRHRSPVQRQHPAHHERDDHAQQWLPLPGHPHLPHHVLLQHEDEGNDRDRDDESDVGVRGAGSLADDADEEGAEQPAVGDAGNAESEHHDAALVGAEDRGGGDERQSPADRGLAPHPQALRIAHRGAAQLGEHVGDGGGAPGGQRRARAAHSRGSRGSSSPAERIQAVIPSG